MSGHQQSTGFRFFHRGSVAPPASMAEVLRTQAAPEALYRGGEQAGDLALVVSQMRRVMAQIHAGAPLAGDLDSRRRHLLEALAERAHTPQTRLRILQHLGRFRFERSESPSARKGKVMTVVGDPAADPRAAVRLLCQIWKPLGGGFLDRFLHRPAEAADVVMARLDGGQVTVVSQRLDGIDRGQHLDFVRHGAVAGHDGGVVWVLGGVEEALRSGAGPGGLAGLHLLLLHQVVAGLLGEAGLEAGPAQVVGDTLVRSLAGQALDQAVDEFCAAWESRAATPSPVDPGDAANAEAPGPEAAADSWQECLISEADLRPEAFIPRTLAEQRAILRDMFGDDWTEQDERELTSAAA